MAFDQMKMLNDLRKAQKELAKEIIEVEAGEGAVTVQITGELKIKDLKITLPFLNGELYFSYMEKYIEELEAYLMASGLKNYHLTKYDKKVLDKFNELYENAPETRET